MKAENKKYRIVVLLIGLGFYYIYFATPWDSKYWYLDTIDFGSSFVSWSIHDFLFVYLGNLQLSFLLLIKKFGTLAVNVGYLYCLWIYREDIIVFIKKLINKI